MEERKVLQQMVLEALDIHRQTRKKKKKEPWQSFRLYTKSNTNFYNVTIKTWRIIYLAMRAEQRLLRLDINSMIQERKFASSKSCFFQNLKLDLLKPFKENEKDKLKTRGKYL